MPRNLIIGYGYGKSKQEMKKQTDEAEERGSSVLGPIGGAKKRRAMIRDLLIDFIKVAEQRINSPGWRGSWSQRGSLSSLVMDDRSLIKRLEVAKQIQIDMQMSGLIPSDLDLQQLSYEYYYDDADDRDN